MSGKGNQILCGIQNKNANSLSAYRRSKRRHNLNGNQILCRFLNKNANRLSVYKE